MSSNALFFSTPPRQIRPSGQVHELRITAFMNRYLQNKERVLVYGLNSERKKYIKNNEIKCRTIDSFNNPAIRFFDGQENFNNSEVYRTSQNDNFKELVELHFFILSKLGVFDSQQATENSKILSSCQLAITSASQTKTDILFVLDGFSYDKVRSGQPNFTYNELKEIITLAESGFSNIAHITFVRNAELVPFEEVKEQYERHERTLSQRFSARTMNA